MNPIRAQIDLTEVGKSMSKVSATLAQNIKGNYGNIERILDRNEWGLEGEREKFRKDGVIQDDYWLTLLKTIFVSFTGEAIMKNEPRLAVPSCH